MTITYDYSDQIDQLEAEAVRLRNEVLYWKMKYINALQELPSTN